MIEEGKVQSSDQGVKRNMSKEAAVIAAHASMA